MSKRKTAKCDICSRRGISTKARTICNECRDFLCKECSDMHLFHKLSMDHSLIDLDPPGEDSRSANEDELASDFLEHVTVSETTVLYRAQVAVESGSTSNGQKKSTKEGDTKSSVKDVDVTKMKVKKIRDFSVKRSDDKESVYVTGVLGVHDKVIIVDHDNKKLKLYDRSGNYLSSTDLMGYPWGITQVNTDRFATCGMSSKVFLWTLRGDTIVSEDVAYDVDHKAHGIHYNNTYYCVLHNLDNAVTILDRQGRRVRKIVMKEAFGKKIEFGCDIHMDSDKHNIYIPCWTPDGVLCMSVEGEALWFTPLSDTGLRGITEIHGVLCVADGKEDKPCLHLISKTGQYKGTLLEKEELIGRPLHIYYNVQGQKLYVSYSRYSDKGDIISVYSLQRLSKYVFF